MPVYLPNAPLTVTSLQGLAHNTWWQSDGLDNTADDAIGIHIQTRIVTTSAVGNLRGACILFLAGSNDGGTTYAGGCTGSEGILTGALDGEAWKSLKWMGRIHARADEATGRTFDQVVYWNQQPPAHYALSIQNATGQALSGSGNLVSIRKIKAA